MAESDCTRLGNATKAIVNNPVVNETETGSTFVVTSARDTICQKYQY